MTKAEKNKKRDQLLDQLTDGKISKAQYREQLAALDEFGGPSVKFYAGGEECTGRDGETFTSRAKIGVWFGPKIGIYLSAVTLSTLTRGLSSSDADSVLVRAAQTALDNFDGFNWTETAEARKTAAKAELARFVKTAAPKQTAKAA